MSHMLAQTFFVNSPDLFQKNNRILAEPNAAACNIDMGGKPGFPGLAGDRSCDDCGRVAIACIILYSNDVMGITAPLAVS